MSDMLVEIVVDKNQPWVVCFKDGTRAELPAAGTIADVMTAFTGEYITCAAY